MNKPKKHIMFCSTSYYEYDRRIQRIISVLIKNDYTISWISRFYNNKSQVINKVNHQELRLYFKSGLLFYVEINFKIFVKLLFSKGHIICSIDNDTIVPCFFASKILRKKLVFDAHEIFHEVPELINKPFKKKIWKNISKWLYPKITHKYTVNDSLKNVFKEEFNTDFKVIRNVPKLSQVIISRPKSESKTLVYLGVLNKGRGIELAIQSLIHLSDYRLKLIGDGDIKHELEELVTKLNLESRVQFLGYLEPADIGKELSTSSIGINMLIPDSDNYKLSLANKFFDYIHACLPSVNMAFHEYSNINSEYCVSILVDEYSTDELVRAVINLQQENVYNNIQKNCDVASQNYNWQLESKKIISIYNSL